MTTAAVAQDATVWPLDLHMEPADERDYQESAAQLRFERRGEIDGLTRKLERQEGAISAFRVRYRISSSVDSTVQKPATSVPPVFCPVGPEPPKPPVRRACAVQTFPPAKSFSGSARKFPGNWRSAVPCAAATCSRA
jgi:hypothetical protein